MYATKAGAVSELSVSCVTYELRSVRCVEFKFKWTRALAAYRRRMRSSVLCGCYEVVAPTMNCYTGAAAAADADDDNADLKQNDKQSPSTTAALPPHDSSSAMRSCGTGVLRAQ